MNVPVYAKGLGRANVRFARQATPAEAAHIQQLVQAHFPAYRHTDLNPELVTIRKNKPDEAVEAIGDTIRHHRLLQPEAGEIKESASATLLTDVNRPWLALEKLNWRVRSSKGYMERLGHAMQVMRWLWKPGIDGSFE